MKKLFMFAVALVANISLAIFIFPGFDLGNVVLGESQRGTAYFVGTIIGSLASLWLSNKMVDDIMYSPADSWISYYKIGIFFDYNGAPLRFIRAMALATRQILVLAMPFIGVLTARVYSGVNCGVEATVAVWIAVEGAIIVGSEIAKFFHAAIAAILEECCKTL